MPLVDVMDESFVYAPAAAIAVRLRDPVQLRRWWPHLELAVAEDRKDEGVRWTVTGSLVGTSEIWLEPADEGVVVHYYLRADPTRRGSTVAPSARLDRRARLGRRLARQHSAAFKAAVWALKDDLEADRPVGAAPVQSADEPAET